MIEAGADIHAKEKSGKTPLVHAVDCENDAVEKVLRSLGSREGYRGHSDVVIPSTDVFRSARVSPPKLISVRYIEECVALSNISTVVDLARIR